MKMELDHHYDADVETVFQLISNADFIERKYVALGGLDVKADRTETDGGGAEVVTTRTVEVDLPGFAKKVLSPKQTTIQNEVWSAAREDGSRTCEYHVDSKGAPAKISGKHTLKAGNGGTDHHLLIEIKVSVPLIGGKIEGFAGDTARSDLAKQFDFTDKELAG